MFAVFDKVIDSLERTALPFGSVRADLVELANKIAVASRFLRAGSHVGSARRRGTLPDLVAEARRLPAWEAAWVVEGIGHARALARMRAGTRPAAILGDDLDRVDRGNWLPLHTGLGLALAGLALDRAANGEPLDRALGRFFDQCAAGCRPGYEKAAVEGLGFAARNLRSSLLPAVDAHLRRAAPDRVGTFWHGVGRGHYFVPAHAAPGSFPTALATARREPPDETARANATAGLAWAATLVNLRHPTVIERTLAACPADARAAFADGVAGAFAIWLDTFGTEPDIASIRRHDSRSPLWRDLVLAPLCAAQARVREAFRPEEVFTMTPSPAKNPRRSR